MKTYCRIYSSVVKPHVVHGYKTLKLHAYHKVTIRKSKVKLHGVHRIKIKVSNALKRR